jgi:hypothetical protein
LIDKNKLDIGGGPVTEIEKALEKGGVDLSETEITIESPIDDSSKADEKEDEDMYSIKNFSL